MPAATTQSVFFPYRNAGESLELTPGGTRADGRPAELRWSLDSATGELWELPDWEEVEVTFELGVSEGAPTTRDLIPPSEVAEPPVSLLALVHCGATLRRWGVRGSWDPATDSGRIALALRRSDLSGTVEVTCHLVRTAQQDEIDALASAAGSRLAYSRVWRLHIDPPAARFGPGLETRWEDFRVSKSTWRREHPALLWHLDTTSEQPVLFLNAGVELDLRTVLEDQAPTGKSARLRELLFAAAQLAVWPTLLATALTSVNSEGEVDPGWQRNVLAHLASRVNPDATPDVALADLIKDLRDPNGGRSVHERVAAAVLTHSNLRPAAEVLIRELF